MKKIDGERQNTINVDDDDTETTLTGEESVKVGESNAEHSSSGKSKRDKSNDKESRVEKSEISDLKLPTNRRSLTKLEVIDAMKRITRQSMKKSGNERAKGDIKLSSSDKQKSKHPQAVDGKKSEITDNSGNAKPGSSGFPRVDEYLADRAERKSKEEEKSKIAKKQPMKRRYQEDTDAITNKKPKPSAVKGDRKITKPASKEAALQSEISDKSGKMRTRSQKSTDEKSKQTSNDDTKSASEVEEQVTEYYTCKVCSQSFSNMDNYKKHKMSCTNIAKKHVCTKCSKSFSQKSLLTQHFDYRHTTNPRSLFASPVENPSN